MFYYPEFDDDWDGGDEVSSQGSDEEEGAGAGREGVDDEYSDLLADRTPGKIYKTTVISISHFVKLSFSLMLVGHF